MREKDINTIQNNNATYSVHVYVFEYKWTYSKLMKLFLSATGQTNHKANLTILRVAECLTFINRKILK